MKIPSERSTVTGEASFSGLTLPRGDFVIFTVSLLGHAPFQAAIGVETDNCIGVAVFYRGDANGDNKLSRPLGESHGWSVGERK